MREDADSLAARAQQASPLNRFASRPSSLAGMGIFCVAVVLLLREARPLMLPLATALLLACVLSPLVGYLRKRGVPQFIGAGILVTVLVGGVGLLCATLAVPAAEWWQRAPTSMAELITQGERLGQRIGILDGPGAAADPTPPDAVPNPLREKIFSESVALTGLLLQRVFSFTLSSIATVLLLYFLLASEPWLVSRSVQAIRRRRTRALVLSGARRAQREIGRFIRSLTVINLGVGLATTLLMNHLGLPNPLLWGCTAAFLNFIPYIGPILMMGVLTLAGLVSFGSTPVLILAPAIGYLCIHAIEANFVSTWFIGRQLALSRISVFLSVMFWGWMWGVAGAVLAVPILIAVRTIVRRVPRLRWLSAYLAENGEAPTSLSTLLGKDSKLPSAADLCAGHRQKG